VSVAPVPARWRQGRCRYLVDAPLLGRLRDADFTPPEAAARVGAAGRGGVLAVEFQGRPGVLRHYRRGGMVERWLGDRYLWTGLERTRAFREWRLLARLVERGLPVPRPLAARVCRDGLFWRGDLVTLRVPRARSLAEWLDADPGRVDWAAVGRCIRRFHDAGVWHADLNAHNVLLDDRGGVWWVDLDRGRLRPPGRWRWRNLARLERSLRKLSREAGRPFPEEGWSALRRVYGGGAGLNPAGT